MSLQITHKLFISKFIAFFGGCFVCYLLQKELGLSAVAASASTGFIGSFLHFPRYYEKNGLHAAIYAGTFAGMCSFSILESPVHIMAVSLIGAGLYLISRPYAVGIGGKLGTISFISGLIFLLSKGAW